MNEDTCYDHIDVDNIRIIYLFAIVLWIIIIWYLDLYNTDTIGGIILMIPIIYYIFSMFSVVGCVRGVEDEIFQTDVFLFGGALIAILVSNKHSEYSSYFYKLIFVGVLLAGLSVTDVWASKKSLALYKHIKTILEIASTFIFVYLFYTFYFVSYNTNNVNKDPYVDFFRSINLV